MLKISLKISDVNLLNNFCWSTFICAFSSSANTWFGRDQEFVVLKQSLAVNRAISASMLHKTEEPNTKNILKSTKWDQELNLN